MRGKQVSPPAPFRKVALGSRLEVATHTAGVNPAYLVTQLMDPFPLPGTMRGKQVAMDPSPLRGG
jgi:hypothetical protein